MAPWWPGGRPTSAMAMTLSRCWPRCRAVESVTLEEGGVLAALNENTVHVSMSTIGVALSERLALEHARTHHDDVAARVFGRPDAAIAGKLFIVAAGTMKASHHRLSASVLCHGKKTFVVDEKPPTANLWERPLL
jgi:3-hydroxyisobutyrate dehydrogenase-like beta-hydroxyacid dehydrogenase